MTFDEWLTGNPKKALNRLNGREVRLMREAWDASAKNAEEQYNRKEKA